MALPVSWRLTAITPMPTSRANLDCDSNPFAVRRRRSRSPNPDATSLRGLAELSAPAPGVSLGIVRARLSASMSTPKKYAHASVANDRRKSAVRRTDRYRSGHILSRYTHRRGGGPTRKGTCVCRVCDREIGESSYETSRRVRLCAGLLAWLEQHDVPGDAQAVDKLLRTAVAVGPGDGVLELVSAQA